MKSVHSVAAIAALAVGAGALVLPQIAQGEVNFVERVDAGELRLETDGGDSLTVVYTSPDGEVETRKVTLQRKDKCVVPTGDFADLLALGGLGTVGLVSNGLGSSDGKNCSSSNGQIADGESLTLGLGSFFGDDVLVDSFSLDVEGKYNASLSYRTNEMDVIDPSFVAGLGSDSDNGSDAGPEDNTTVESDESLADFRTLTISPQSDDGRGTISLEGGGDYAADAAVNRTVFELVRVRGYEYSFDCGTSIEESTATLFLSSPPVPGVDLDVPVNARVIRYQNGPKGGDCIEIGAGLSADEIEGELSVWFQNTTASADGVEQDPRLRIEMIWYVLQPLTMDQVPDRRIDLVGDGVLFNEAVPCLSFELGDAAGPMDINDPGIVERPDDTPWCLISDVRRPITVTLADGSTVNVIEQTQIWDGYGDPRWL